MYWILAAILLIVLLFVPKLRPSAIAGLVVLGALLAWAMLGRLRDDDASPQVERGRPTTPATALSAFPADQIELENLQLSGGGAPFRLTGSVGNQSSDLLLKSLMLNIARRDCHAEALDPSGCALLWQTSQWIDLAVPPGETRNIAVSIWARGDAPRAIGTVRDEFKIVTASGQPFEAEKK
jgi:hypothetical protein